MNQSVEAIDVSTRELVELAAIDWRLYTRHFFPRAFRLPSPTFHDLVWTTLADSNNRLVALKIARDLAKTTLCRAFASHRIAYGISKTILLVGKGENSALRTLDWLRRQVEFNKEWAQTYRLSRGDKWSGHEIEIIQSFPDNSFETVRLLGMGITGQIRGINIDDYRPDLILLDDPLDEENTATPEQREKTEELISGALVNSLASRAESPDATAAFLQTPLNREDAIERRMKDPEWVPLQFGVFDEHGQSRWPEKYPTIELMQQKQAAVERNQLSIWLREKECKLISPETSAFVLSRVKYWTVMPDQGLTVMAIDPVPPPSEKALQTGLRTNDYEALLVLRYFRGDCYVCEYAHNRGHEPDWTIANFFRLVDKWNPLRVRVEPTGYQRTLKWLLDREMSRRRRWIQFNEPKGERRAKTYRIVDAITGPLHSGHLYLHPTQIELIQQLNEYPDVNHDDVIESLAEAITEAKEGFYIEGDYDVVDESNIPALEGWRCAP